MEVATRSVDGGIVKVPQTSSLRYFLRFSFFAQSRYHRTSSFTRKRNSEPFLAATSFSVVNYLKQYQHKQHQYSQKIFYFSGTSVKYRRREKQRKHNGIQNIQYVYVIIIFFSDKFYKRQKEQANRILTAPHGTHNHYENQSKIFLPILFCKEKHYNCNQSEYGGYYKCRIIRNTEQF